MSEADLQTRRRAHAKLKVRCPPACLPCVPGCLPAYFEQCLPGHIDQPTISRRCLTYALSQNSDVDSHAKRSPHDRAHVRTDVGYHLDQRHTCCPNWGTIFGLALLKFDGGNPRTPCFVRGNAQAQGQAYVYSKRTVDSIAIPSRTLACLQNKLTPARPNPPRFPRSITPYAVD